MELLKSYHTKKFHYRMLRDVALNVELEFNNMNTQLFESDIQSYMDNFLRSNLKNTHYYPHRETCGKTDLVIFQSLSDESGMKHKKGIIFFEIKTVFKKHESFSNMHFLENIRKDFLKLKNRKEHDTRALFIVVFRKNKSKQIGNLDNISELINNKLASKSYRNHFDINIKNEKIVVRASSKCIIENTVVLTWEIIS